jgi:hypothetical protein
MSNNTDSRKLLSCSLHHKITIQTVTMVPVLMCWFVLLLWVQSEGQTLHFDAFACTGEDCNVQTPSDTDGICNHISNSRHDGWCADSFSCCEYTLRAILGTLMHSHDVLLTKTAMPKVKQVHTIATRVLDASAVVQKSLWGLIRRENVHRTSSRKWCEIASRLRIFAWATHLVPDSRPNTL